MSILGSRLPRVNVSARAFIGHLQIIIIIVTYLCQYSNFLEFKLAHFHFFIDGGIIFARLDSMSPLFAYLSDSVTSRFRKWNASSHW